jgi:hypothetical protein
MTNINQTPDGMRTEEGTLRSAGGSPFGGFLHSLLDDYQLARLTSIAPDGHAPAVDRLQHQGSFVHCLQVLAAPAQEKAAGPAAQGVKIADNSPSEKMEESKRAQILSDRRSCRSLSPDRFKTF